MPGFKGTEAAIPIAFTPSHRPPVITRNRWMEMFHRQPIQFHHVPLGWERPRYHYSGHRWRDHSWYFPYYYDGPWMTGFYYSPFALYTGWFPTYIYPERIVYVEHRVYLRDISSDDDDYDYYSSQTSSLRDTMADIKAAWLDGEGGLLLQHINTDIAVRIYQKDVYKYSLEPEDYRDITKDALNRVNTLDFEWTKVDRRSTDEVYLEAKHTFKDPDGDRHIVRLTYTLEKASGYWWITETGTAKWYNDL